jgi:hypothetical protein
MMKRVLSAEKSGFSSAKKSAFQMKRYLSSLHAFLFSRYFQQCGEFIAAIPIDQ